MNPESNNSAEILNPTACDEDVDVAQLEELLPAWKTHILEAKIIDKENFPKLSLRFLLDAHSVEEIQKWLTELQERNKTTYTIYCTAKSSGRYVYFKQRLVCQHKTRSTRVYDPSVKSLSSTKNTNCPSKMTIVWHAVKDRYRGKNEQKAVLLRRMPVEVTFIATHNHPTSSPDTLRFRKMSDEVKEKLLQLFHDGHTPSSALELIKADLILNNENHQELLADRKYCPTYQDCYHLYRRELGEELFNKSSRSGKRRIVNQEELVENETESMVEVEVKPVIYQIQITSDSDDDDDNDNDEEDDDDGDHHDDDDDDDDPEIIKAKARAILARINAKLLSLVDDSPMEMIAGLENFEETLQMVESPAVFISSYCPDSEPSHYNYTSIQSISIDR